MNNYGGLILGVCVMMAAAIIAMAPRLTGGSNEVGRYQFERSNGVNVFVLDTKTGRLWQRFVDPSGGSSDWTENKSPWAEAHGK
ncbi:MAG TPA: hypothetical protein PLX97_16375 [Gemmatales bacterium]|nr:hypothetical protein [Gemmatales bacterium]